MKTLVVLSDIQNSEARKAAGKVGLSYSAFARTAIIEKINRMAQQTNTVQSLNLSVPARPQDQVRSWASMSDYLNHIWLFLKACWMKQRFKAVESISKGESHQRTTENLGLSERTLRRWSKIQNLILKLIQSLWIWKHYAKGIIKIAKTTINQIFKQGMRVVKTFLIG